MYKTQIQWEAEAKSLLRCWKKFNEERYLSEARNALRCMYLSKRKGEAVDFQGMTRDEYKVVLLKSKIKLMEARNPSSKYIAIWRQELRTL